MSNLIKGPKERKVSRVGLAYAIVAWGLIKMTNRAAALTLFVQLMLGTLR